MLLATKLRTPRPRTGWVPRPRLVQRLRAGTERELVLVCGPAGFGKSSLLADWVRGDRRAVAWLSLDAADNDPVRFWRHVAAALDGVRPGVAERVGAARERRRVDLASTAAVTALVNELAAAPDDVALVVDDYHLIDAPEVHRSLEFLLDHLPASLHLVLASRSDPPLPLARLRARGQLTELRADELRFTPDETAELLRVTVGHDLPDAVVAALGERTEGWAAGLQLAALSLQGRADVTRFVEEFSGSHRFVLDYLTEEVLERQPEELRTFLLETSILERLSGSLCDAVVGRTEQPADAGVGGAGEPVPDPARRGASLVALPPPVRRPAARQPAAAAPGAGARAAPRRGELVRAARAAGRRHPARAGGRRGRPGRPGWSRRHLEEQIRRRAEVATLVSWLAALPSEVIHRRPVLALGQAKVTLMAGRLDEVEPLLTMAERAFDQARRRAVPGLDRPQGQPAGQRAGRRRDRPRRPGSPARRRRPRAHCSPRPPSSS